jgi:RNA polymerase sigma-70 factor, ECF subfamily
LNLPDHTVVWTGMNERGLAIDTERAPGRTAGDERAVAFTALAEAHLLRAYRLAAVILGSETEAQDAVQDAAAAAWQRFADLRERERFDAWFDRILVNGCRDRLRARGRTRPRLISVAAEGPGLPSTPDASAALAERDALRSALTRLPHDQRLIVVLRYYGDLSLDEIADRTGERLGTVKSRLHYGIQALRAAYDAAARETREVQR